MDKKERMSAAFHYLRDNGYLHTQKDMAAAIESTPPNISRMLAGDPRVLTDNICVRVQRAYPVISANWLIHGEGEMVITDNNTERQMMMPDPSSVTNAIIASKDETIAEKDARIESLKRELAKTEESAKRELAEKDARIADKQAMIVKLEEQVDELKHRLSVYQSKELLGDYPFKMGTADDGERPRVKK